MEQRQGTWDRIDAAVRAGTGRVHGFTGLLVAVLSLGTVATLLWSLAVGLGERQLLIQVPLGGPQLLITDFSHSSSQGKTPEQQTAAADSEAFSELEPIGVEEVMQQVMPMLSPLQFGPGVCFYGQFGQVKIYPPGRRRGGRKP